MVVVKTVEKWETFLSRGLKAFVCVFYTPSMSILLVYSALPLRMRPPSWATGTRSGFKKSCIYVPYSRSSLPLEGVVT